MTLINNASKEDIIKVLIRRLWAIQEAVSLGKLSLEQLKEFSKASYMDMLDPSTSLFAQLKTFETVVLEGGQLTLVPNQQIINHFCHFDEVQGDYLYLPALAVDTVDTVRANLNDLASLYLHFGQYITVKDADLDAEDAFNFDEKTAEWDWQNWLSTRPVRSNLLRAEEIDLEPSCLFDKFLAGRLGPQEWLSDTDIAYAFKQFGILQAVPIVRFKADEIGLNLHFSREAHCDSADDYYIPMILNLGKSNHSRLDDRCQHWVQMLVKVSPRNNTIVVNYVDSVQLNSKQKKEIEDTLKKAFAYTETIGNALSGGAKYYQAYGSEYNITYNIKSSDTQRDSYTCGYRAVQGLVIALEDAGVIEPSKEIDSLRQTQDPEQLRNLFYVQLICSRELTDNEIARMHAIGELLNENNKRFIDSAIVLASLELSCSATRIEPKKERMEKLISSAQIKKLKEIAMEQEVLKELAKAPQITALAEHAGKEINLNIDELLKALAKYSQALIIKAIFKALAENVHIKQLNLKGCDGCWQEFILEDIDGLVGVEISSVNTDTMLKKIINCINWRNKQIQSDRLKSTQDPWAAAFNCFFSKPNHALPEELNSDFAMQKLSQYFAEYKDKWLGGSNFIVLNMQAIDSARALKFLRENKNNIPYREVGLKLKGGDLTNDNFTQLCCDNNSNIQQFNIDIKEPSKKLRILLEVLRETVNYHDHKNAKGYFTKRLNFSLNLQNIEEIQNIKEIQNIIECRRRQDSIAPPSQSVLPAQGDNSIYLVMFGDKDANLDIAIDQEQEQQQQQEQQMQCEVVDEEVEEERGANEEKFGFFATDEELIDRSNISEKMGFFIKQQGIELEAEVCWDLIVGTNADKFKYGIKKITRSAAEKLILNIRECRYGLCLDNLPVGFSVHEDFEGALFLSYNPVDCSSNKTPLTLNFDEQPMAAEIWLGDMSQFLSSAQQQELYKSISATPRSFFHKKNKSETQVPAFSSAQQQQLYQPINVTPRSFFHKKNKSETEVPAELSWNFFGLLEINTPVDTKLKIIAAIAGAKFCQEIKELLNDSFTNDNLMAIAHMLYKGNIALRCELFLKLTQLKAKNLDYFAKFKKNFMDPSQNWSELATREAIDAISKIIQFTPTQLLWWQELTAQHHLGLEAVASTKTAWISLVACMQSFCYFQEKLDEISPGLKLLEYFPFKDVLHMRLGLERLLSIMHHARDKVEQWALLQGCALNALGPFYASRYEGFTVVSAAMGLQYDFSNEKTELQEACAFRLNKENIRSRLSFEFNSIVDLKKRNFLLLDAEKFSRPITEPGCILWTQKGTQLHYKFHNGEEEIKGALFTHTDKQYNQDELNQSRDALTNAIIKKTPTLPFHLPSFLRYPATFNTRFDYAKYQTLLNIIRALNKFFKENRVESYEGILASLMSVMLEICVGKSCKIVNLQQLEVVLIAPLRAAIEENYDFQKIVRFDFFYRGLSLWVKHGTLDLDKIRIISERLVFEEEKALAEQAEIDVVSCFYQSVIFIVSGIPHYHKQNNLDVLMKYAVNKRSGHFFSLGQMLNYLKTSYDLTCEEKCLKEDEGLLWTLLIKALCCIDISFLQGSYSDIQRSQKEEYKKTLDKLNSLLQLFPQYKQTLLAIIEKWSSVDVEASTQLPTLQSLTQLLDEIEGLFMKRQSLDLREVHAIVRKYLPADIRFDKAIIESAPYQMQGSLSSVLSTQMGEIIAGLEKEIANLLEPMKEFAKAAVETSFGKNYKKLRSAEGANILMSMLVELKVNKDESENFLHDKIRETVQRVMTKIYDNLVQNQANAISPNLHEVFTVWLPNPLQKLSFNDFSDKYAEILSCVNRSLGKLLELKKKWPKQFQTIEHILTTHTGLVGLDIFDLEHIVSMLMDNLPEKQAFPVRVLNFILGSLQENENKKAILEQHYFCLNAILVDNNKYNFTEEELLYLLQLPSMSADFLQSLCALKEQMPKSFCKILTFNLLDHHSLAKFIVTLKALIEKLTAEWVEILIDLADEANFMNGFLELGGILDKYLMQLMLQQAKRSPEDKTRLLAVLLRLEKAPSLIPVVKTLYALPPYPSLTDLEEALAAGDQKKALASLLSQYDSDPYGYRQRIPGLINEQFDSRKFEFLVNGAQDLLAERELVLEERQQLYDWLIYINDVGQNAVILVDGKAKAIINMTRDEILSLVAASKKRLQEKSISPQEKIKLKLEFIALMREAMYRATTTSPTPTQNDLTQLQNNPGRFAYPNQLLFLLNAMQKGDKFIAEIATGQGKSLTAALALGLCHLEEGYPTDVISSSIHLAAEGLNENKGFFDYLAIPCTLIHASSTRSEYVEGGVHYTSLPDRALYKLAQERKGYVFPENIVGIIDEVDFYSLDDNLNYRLAISLDPVRDPHESPYRWIYEKAIEFVDNQTEKNDDKGYIEKFKEYLLNTHVNKEKKEQLQGLLDLATGDERLKTWLLAAAKTAFLQHQEEKKFRILSIKKKIKGEIVEASKACILVNGQPKPEAEFSDAIQQFLHLRLLKKYEIKIQAGNMPLFLVEPEKACFAKLTSRLMLGTYKRLWGLTGTAGSEKERLEQHTKYKVAMTRLPSYHPSRRKYLAPILTNYFSKESKEIEENQHIELIVVEILRYRNNSDSPILIHCQDKLTGEKIAQALEIRQLGATQYYGSDDPKIDAQHKAMAGNDGAITISTVFSRGTDIKPKHKDGLYSISTYVNNPNSVEDLTRSLQQAFGRAARQDQEGSVRLILRRSEFVPIFSGNPRTLKKLKPADTYLAIERLNAFYSQPKATERNEREKFDQVVHLFFAEFLRIYRQLKDRATGEDSYMLEWTKFLKALAQEKPNNVNKWVKDCGFDKWCQFLEKLRKIDASAPVEIIDNFLTINSILINISPKLARTNKFYVSKKQYNPDELLPIRKKDPLLIRCMLDPNCSQKDKKQAVDLSLETIFEQLHEKYSDVVTDLPESNRHVKIENIDNMINEKLKVWLKFILSKKMAMYLDDKNADEYNSPLKEITELLMFCNDKSFNAIWETVNLEHYTAWMKECKRLGSKNKAICYMRTFLRDTTEGRLQWKAKCLGLELADFHEELIRYIKGVGNENIKDIMQDLCQNLASAISQEKDDNKINVIYLAMIAARKKLADILLNQPGSMMSDFDLSPLHVFINERKRRLMFTCVGAINARVEFISLGDVFWLFEIYNKRGAFKKLGGERNEELQRALQRARVVMAQDNEDPLEPYRALLILCAKIQFALGDVSKDKDENLLRSLYYYTLNLRADLLFRCDMYANELKKLNDSVTAILYTTAPIKLGKNFFSEIEKDKSFITNISEAASIAANRISSSRLRAKTDGEKSELPLFFTRKPRRPSVTDSMTRAASIVKKELNRRVSRSSIEDEREQDPYCIDYNNSSVEILFSPASKVYYGEAVYKALLLDLEKNIVECKPEESLKVCFKKILVASIEDNREVMTINLTINNFSLQLYLEINKEKKTIIMDDNLLDDNYMNFDFSSKTAEIVDLETPVEEKDKEASEPLSSLIPKVIDSELLLPPPLTQSSNATLSAIFSAPLPHPITQQSTSLRGAGFFGNSPVRKEEETVGKERPFRS